MGQSITAPRPRTNSDNKSDEESFVSSPPAAIKAGSKVIRKSVLTSSVDNLALRLKEKVNKSTSDVHNPNASNKVIKFPEIEQTEQISEVGVKDDKPGDNEASPHPPFPAYVLGHGETWQI